MSHAQLASSTIVLATVRWKIAVRKCEKSGKWKYRAAIDRQVNGKVT